MRPEKIPTAKSTRAETAAEAAAARGGARKMPFVAAFAIAVDGLGLGLRLGPVAATRLRSETLWPALLELRPTALLVPGSRLRTSTALGWT